jgi:hypothetical protein
MLLYNTSETSPANLRKLDLLSIGTPERTAAAAIVLALLWFAVVWATT